MFPSSPKSLLRKHKVRNCDILWKKRELHVGWYLVWLLFCFCSFCRLLRCNLGPLSLIWTAHFKHITLPSPVPGDVFPRLGINKVYFILSFFSVCLCCRFQPGSASLSWRSSYHPGPSVGWWPDGEHVCHDGGDDGTAGTADGMQKEMRLRGETQKDRQRVRPSEGGGHLFVIVQFYGTSLWNYVKAKTSVSILLFLNSSR